MCIVYLTMGQSYVRTNRTRFVFRFSKFSEHVCVILSKEHESEHLIVELREEFAGAGIVRTYKRKPPGKYA